MSKIIYFTQRYRPEFEATSKEVQILHEDFKESKIHDLHLDSCRTIKLGGNYWSYHFLFYPLTYPFVYAGCMGNIIHLYTGVPDSLYLPTLPKEKMVITAANYFSANDLQRKKFFLKKANKIIVQSELQKQNLLAAGISPVKIEMILPPVKLEDFSYKSKIKLKDGEIAGKGAFRILNASCPTNPYFMEKRGIFLLYEALRMAGKDLSKVEITLAWRTGAEEAKKRIIERFIHPDPRVIFASGTREDMNQEFAQHQATIIPYLCFDPYLKMIPISAVESLAAGKPVLVSSQTGIAELVKKEGCGVVFEPRADSLVKAISELRKNYAFYQKNCRSTAEKYFSQQDFIKKHREVYQSLS